MKRIVIAVVSIAFAVGSVFAGNKTIEVSDLHATATGSIQSINGIAQSTGGKIIKTAFLEFNLYDAQGNLVDNTITMAKDIEPNISWKLNTPTPTSFNTFKLTGVKIYDN